MCGDKTRRTKALGLGFRGLGLGLGVWSLGFSLFHWMKVLSQDSHEHKFNGNGFRVYRFRVYRFRV